VPSNDPYRLLGVPRGANGDDVRKAYRRLARAHHPDANPDDPAAEQRFKEIQQAYELLSDPEKRRAYDDEKRSSRPSPRRKRAGAPGPPRAGAGANRRSVDLSDLLAKRVNVSRTPNRRALGSRVAARGEDLARISKVLGVDLARLSKLTGENIQMNAKVSFGNGAGRKPPGPPKSRRPFGASDLEKAAV
jgi:DnaJ-class molecular chaperone